VEVWHQGRDSLHCCGVPLKFLAVEEAALLDLVEHWVDGQSYWHLPRGEPARCTFPCLDPAGREGCCEVG
jgi:hypothetical protein